jgi:hypothetical protein
MILRIPIAATIACLLGCSMPERFPTLAPEHGEAPKATRFAVLPPNALVRVPPELSGATGPLLGTITRYLAVQGRERMVIEPSRTQQIWRASILEVERSDSRSRDFRGAMKVFARRLGEFTAFDALVVPSLVYRQARLQNQRAKWDGAVRRIDDAEDESRRVPETFKATVPAVSLHLMIFDARGELIFENYGGVDLAHALSLEPRDGELRAELREVVLGERRLLSEGVELAFEPYLPKAPAGW